MFSPSTPTRGSKADDEINTVIQGLSAKWGLQLPVRDALWSPSKSTVNAGENNVYQRVKYLYWKDKRALNCAVAEFERRARTNSNWVPKPHADPDVLPSRSIRPSTRHDTFLKKRSFSDKEAAALTNVLVDVLKTVTEKIAAGLPYTFENGLQEEKPITPMPAPSNSHSPTTKLPRQSTISSFFVKTPHGGSALGKENTTKPQNPSSDEFAVDESDLLEFAKVGIPPKSSGPGPQPGSSDREYGTPPDDILAQGKAESQFRKPDPVLAQSKSRKRSFPETAMPAMSRNVSREKRSSGYSRSHSAEEIGAQVPIANTPSCQADTELTRSFGSVSTTSLASSTTRPSTGFTTPNISFRADSLNTSFDSANEEGDSTTMTITGKPYNGRDLRPTSAPVCSKLAKLSDDDATESMEIDRSLTGIEADEPPCINGKPKHGMFLHVGGHNVKDYLKQNLLENSPFAAFDIDEASTVSFRQLYEVMRVSRACNLPLAAFNTLLRQGANEYEQLWANLSSIAKNHNSTMPERSNTAAWNRAENSYDCVGLSGGLKFSERADQPLLNFNLKPLKSESSYRLSRKFGGDRFCIISIPGIEVSDLPKCLKDSHETIRAALVKWFVNTEHHFLGRKWRAFYSKLDSKKRKKAIFKSQQPPKPGYRIFFFAEDGKDFSRGATGEHDPRKTYHKPMTVSEMIEWFMPAKENLGQNCLKLYSRLALAVSSTKPTIHFKPSQIIRCDDALAHDPQPRRLKLQRSDDKKRHLNLSTDSIPSNECKVMNDGCARISRAAAIDITEVLGLDTMPSVFQGRIGGAKGVWMVDATNESLPSNQQGNGYWIEITDSQLKFEGHPTDNLFPDRERVTFEVQNWSKKLSAATLNYQLIPILEDRGVPGEVFKRLLEEDLTAKVGELEVAMDSALALRKWNQDNNSMVGERLNNNGIEMLGGLPDSLAEKINWFVEHGFEPKSCRVLKELLYNAIMEYCTRVENNMHIELGKSTYAIMIADPLAILEENEVHIGFSGMFRDTKSEWSEVMLHNIDILVSRSPALLPSDIQKVRAVFKPELGIYRDVIVFPSKGTCSLAEKLSGGDFDGDIAWICWEPSIVDPFQNASVPEPVDLKEFDIEKDRLRVQDIYSSGDFTSKLLLHAFDFNFRVNMLGTCTTYHEAMCYHGTSIGDESATAIAFLLSQLVDRAKNGIIFDEPSWNAYRRRKGLKQYKKPAYKDKANAKPKDTNLIDNMVFEVAKTVRQDALGKFANHFGNVGTQDEDLVRLYTIERDSEEAQAGQPLSPVLYDLKNQLAQIYDYWKRNVTPHDDSKEPTVRRGVNISFRALVEKCRADFLAIEPLALENNPVTKRWKREQNQKHGPRYWDSLKASFVYHEWHKIGRRYPWYVAGVELGELKATARGKGTYRIVTGDIFEALKLDNKMVKRKRELDYGRVTEDEDDEFGDFDWDDIEI